MGVFKYDFDKIASNGIMKYAKKHECAEKFVSIMMYLDSNENDCYAIYLKNAFSENVKILDILNRKIDFTGESLVISHFVKRELKNLAAQNNIEKSKVRVMVVLRDGKVLLYLLNGSNAVKILNSEEMLSDENFAQASNDMLKQIEQ